MVHTFISDVLQKNFALDINIFNGSTLTHFYNIPRYCVVSQPKSLLKLSSIAKIGGSLVEFITVVNFKRYCQWNIEFLGDKSLIKSSDVVLEVLDALFFL